MSEIVRNLRVLCSPAGYYMDGGFSGSEPLWSHEIVTRTASRVCEITAITGDLSEPRLPQNVRAIVIGGMKDADVLAAVVAAKYMFAYGIRGAALIARGNFDLLHHVLPFGLGQTFNLATLALGKRPFVIGPVQGRAYQKHIERISLHGADQQSRFGKPFGNRLADALAPILGRLNAAMLRRADVVIAISDEAARAVALESGVTPIVIPPGVDTAAFRERPPHAGACIRLITVGYLLKRKRVDVTLKALRHLLDLGLDARLAIVGDGPESGELRGIARGLELESHIEWLGFIPNRALPSHYAAADILVSNSEHEGLATVFLEGLATGLPLIGADNPGSRAVLTNELRGRIVPQDDPNATAVAIADVFGTRERFEKRRQAIRADVIGQYDWDVICGHYAKAYADACEIARRRGWKPTRAHER